MKSFVNRLLLVVGRLILGTVLLCLFAFSLFGFLDSFEPGVSLAWKVGYAIVGCLCLMGTVHLLVGRRAN